MTADTVIEFLSTLYERFLLPLTVVSDNGPYFKDHKYTEFLEALNVERWHSIALWPQSNGETERQNRSLYKRLRIAQLESRNWKEELQQYLFNYRATPHSVTGLAPAERFAVLFGLSYPMFEPNVQIFQMNISGIGILSRRKEGGFMVIRNDKP
jgi:transposase InsO family protein